MHDDHDDHVRTKSIGSLSTGDVNVGGDEVNFKLYRANNIEHKFLNNIPTSTQPHKENSSLFSSKCHVTTSMAHPKPYTYYNSQTGTSIIHISSNSSVSNTVRENSNYIERQWAILKEKMLPTTKSNSKPEVDNKAIVSEFVEERCEVDFSFIDEPNGNEPDNNYAKNLDLLKSKNMFSSNPSHKIDSNNSLRCIDDLKNDVEHVDGSIPSLSASMQVSNEPQKLLNKSDCEVATASLNLSKDKPDTLRHSFVEKLNKDHSTDNMVRKSLTLEPTLLVPSFRDEFLSDRDPTHLRSDKVSTRKYHEFSSLKSSQNENVNFYNTMSLPSSNCEVKPNSVEESDCPSSHDVLSNEADQDESKNSEMKSKKYQEMHSRKLKKQERVKNSFTQAKQIPGYKGEDELEDIINFINKDIKGASTIVPQKINKKLKKKTVKKDSINCLLNGIESPKMEPNLEERSEQVNDKAVECHGNISVKLNSESCESSSSVSKNCSEEQEFRPVLFENKVELSGSLKNSVDNEHFSVVKKKKKSKKSVDHGKESHSEKLLESDSSFIESVVDHLGPSLDLCSKTLKNKSNMNTKESISIAESNIPKSRDCQSFTKASEDLKLLKSESRATSNKVTDKFDSIEPRLTELCKSRQICKKNAENSSVSSWKCSDVISFLSKSDDFPPIKPIMPLKTKEITENIMSEIELIHPKKPNSLFSLSKSKSAFNLKHAQAFMNSTYQEVIKSKGYVLYNQSI